MAAVLVVVLLLLCSSVRSSAEEVQGTITQVKVSDSPTTAPAITNTTEGSSDSHSAVLANEALVADDSSPLVLVDLARSDQETLNRTSATPPTADSVPSEFDLTEPDDVVPESFAESTTPPAVDAVPPGFDMNEFGDDSPSLAATQEDQGTLVQGFPEIGSSEDNSHGEGFGVVTYDASSATTEDESPSLAATQDEGTLVQGFPEIGSSADNSHGEGFGVVTYDASSATTEDESPSLAATQDEGTLVQGFPEIGSSADNSHGEGFGVVTYDASSATTEDDSSSASSDDDLSLAATQDEGTLVQGYPEIGSSADNSHGEGYGVVTYDASSATTEDDSSSASSGDDLSLAATQDEGTLVQGFPEIGSSADNSHGEGYGVVTYDASSASTEDDSSSASSGDDLSLAATQDEGTLVQGYPEIGSSADNSHGEGYGVVTYDAPASEHDVLAVYGEEVPDSTENYTLTTTRTYRPMPHKPAPAEAWRKGRGTYYGGVDAAGTMSGACGYGNLYASGYGVYTAALSAKLFNNGLACGACYEVACSGKGKPCKAGSIVVTATNFCPPNPGQSANNGGWCNPPNEHFDLSYPAFTKIADPKAGIVPLQFRRVPCKKTGGIRFTLNGNCNFNLVTITNVGGSGVVIEVYIKGDYQPWAPMSRNWGANWQCTRNYCGKAISIKIVTSDKKVAISELAGKDWAFGKTYVGQQVK